MLFWHVAKLTALREEVGGAECERCRSVVLARGEVACCRKRRRGRGRGRGQSVSGVDRLFWHVARLLAAERGGGGGGRGQSVNGLGRLFWHMTRLLAAGRGGGGRRSERGVSIGFKKGRVLHQPKRPAYARALLAVLRYFCASLYASTKPEPSAESHRRNGLEISTAVAPFAPDVDIMPPSRFTRGGGRV